MDDAEIDTPAQEIAAEPVATPTPTIRAKPTGKRRKAFRSAAHKKPKMPETPKTFWAELRLKYETGEYSQRDLVNYARAKGHIITQPRVSQHVTDEDWVKGTVRAGIRAEVLAGLHKQMGDDIRSMLTKHGQSASVILGEALAHFRVSAESRHAKPTHVMTPAVLESLTRTIKEAQVMEARAMGWNYKEGKPFELEEAEEDKKLPSLRVERMSEQDEANIRNKAEEALKALENAGSSEPAAPT